MTFDDVRDAAQALAAQGVHAMTHQDTATVHDDERSDLRRWQTLLQAFLAAGYSWLGAHEAIQAIDPNLWQAAAAEVARRTWAPRPPRR